jgi:hypothetical protein
VIEAGSQAVLNTVTEHDFQKVLKEIAEARGMAVACKMGLCTLRLMVSSKPKVRF